MKFTAYSAFLMIILLFSRPLFAVDLECVKATKTTQELSNSNPQLLKSNEHLTKIYKQLLKSAINKRSFQEEQCEWMVEQNGYSDISCRLEAYQKRIAALERMEGASGFKIRSQKNGFAIIDDKGSRHFFSISPQNDISAAEIEEASLLFVTKKSASLYLLVQICGPTISGGSNYACGAATDCDLLWFELDSGWNIKGKKRTTYQSCRDIISSDEGYDIKRNILKMKYDNFSKSMDYQFFYDSDHPEQGPVIKESPSPKH